VNLRELSLEALRKRFAGRERVPAQTLARLAADPRAGVRALAAQLATRRARQARELRRLRSLYALERSIRAQGYARIAGVDEVGMGPLAGPVVAAAVVFAERPRLAGLNDSKKLQRSQRESLAAQICEAAVAVALGRATREEIDALNIYRAGLLAMRRAVERLDPPPDWVVVDARTIPCLSMPQRALVRADAQVACVAAASIVAKVERDAEMRRLSLQYPGYGFAQNCGYATAEHLEALRRLGPSPAHRRSFDPVRGLQQAELFEARPAPASDAVLPCAGGGQDR
jgi:ribonuclease HII